MALAHAVRSTTPKVRAFGLTVLAAALLLLGLDAATVADPRLLFPLLPLLVALGVAALTRLAEVFGGGRRIVVQAALALALLVPLMFVAMTRIEDIAAIAFGRWCQKPINR